VTAVSVNVDPETERLTLSTGPIETTPNHRFYTPDRGWVAASALTAGEHVFTASGTDAIVVSFSIDAGPATMWDITVAGAHSFFVGSGQVLVHNCGEGWPEDLYNFGNAKGPALRLDPPGNGLPGGVSAWNDPEVSGLTGIPWRLPAGSRLPKGFGVTNDDPILPGHRTITVPADLDPGTIWQLLNELPWTRGARIR
jgi:hypothetical protein